MSDWPTAHVHLPSSVSLSALFNLAWTGLNYSRSNAKATLHRPELTTQIQPLPKRSPAEPLQPQRLVSRSQGCSAPRCAPSYQDDPSLSQTLEHLSDAGCCIAVGEDFPPPEHNPDSRHGMICLDHSPVLGLQWRHRAAGFASSSARREVVLIP